MTLPINHRSCYSGSTRHMYIYTPLVWALVSPVEEFIKLQR